MTAIQLSDYERVLNIINTIPKFFLGQEVQTKDGKGIIVGLSVEWNGLYIVPESSTAVVWYSTEKSVTKKDGGKWISSIYKISELNNI